MEYAIYFYIGVMLVKTKKKIKNIKVNTLIFVILGLSYCFVIKENLLNIKILMHTIKFLLAIYGTIISISIFKNCSNKISKIKICNIIAQYTFPIYLMHTIFSAGIRIVLLKIGVNNFYIHCILGLALGMLGPIIIAKVLEKIKYGNVILYPLKTIENKGI